MSAFFRYMTMFLVSTGLCGYLFGIQVPVDHNSVEPLIRGVEKRLDTVAVMVPSFLIGYWLTPKLLQKVPYWKDLRSKKEDTARIAACKATGWGVATCCLYCWFTVATKSIVACPGSSVELTSWMSMGMGCCGRLFVEAFSQSVSNFKKLVEIFFLRSC